MKRGCTRSPPQRQVMIFMVTLAIILTDSLTHGQVYVTPNTAVLNEGDRTDLLCNFGRKIDYCRIEVPGEPKALNLSPRWSKTPGFIYHGTTFEAGQCGVTIEHVKSTNNGQVKCTLGVEGDEYVGFIDLVVTLRPQQPIVELITKPDRDGYFQQGSNLHARCIVRDGRPPANISWFLDQYPADKSTSPLEVVESPIGPNSSVSTSVQDIQWQLGPEDNRRMLICRSHHKTDRESLPPQEGAIQLSVRFAPVRQKEILVYGLFLDRTAMVNVTIQANPAPKVEWTVDSIVIPQGHQEGRFSAYEPIPLDYDFYNVTLAIAGLTLEDTTKTYHLRASNMLGSNEYQIRISSSSTPPIAGLDIGAIVGIIVAVAVLVLIILLVVFARATGRWCFGGATLNTDIGPDSEAQINPHLNEELDGREFHNGDEHIDTTHQSEEVTPPVTDKLESQKKTDIKQKSGKSVKTATNETSDTESAEVKATSTVTIATTAGTMADDTEATEGDEASQVKKSKRHLPSLGAMFKRLNERDARKKKYVAETETNETQAVGTTGENENGPQAGEHTDGNDNEPKEDKQLVYAELVLKPTDNNEPTPPPVQQPKNSTEYAEIVYVQKQQPQGEQAKK